MTKYPSKYPDEQVSMRYSWSVASGNYTILSERVQVGQEKFHRVGYRKKGEKDFTVFFEGSRGGASGQVEQARQRLPKDKLPLMAGRGVRLPDSKKGSGPRGGYFRYRQDNPTEARIKAREGRVSMSAAEVAATLEADRLAKVAAEQAKVAADHALLASNPYFGVF